MTVKTDNYNLLCIEDDLSEQKLIKMIVNDSGYSCNITFLNDGEEALNYIELYGADDKSDHRINLILLDLNIPKYNGIDILKKIKQNKYLQKTPVVILTTSNNKNDIHNTYEFGASGFVRKPALINDYEQTIKIIFDYWFGACLTI